MKRIVLDTNIIISATAEHAEIAELFEGSQCSLRTRWCKNEPVFYVNKLSSLQSLTQIIHKIVSIISDGRGLIDVGLRFMGVQGEGTDLPTS